MAASQNNEQRQLFILPSASTVVEHFYLLTLEAVAHRCSVKKVLLEISLNLQENTCARASFLIILQAPATLLKKKFWRMCFPVNFAKFLRTPILTEHLWWLLLILKLATVLERVFVFPGPRPFAWPPTLALAPGLRP